MLSKGSLGAHEHRHLGAAHDFQQTQRVRGFLLGPHIASDGANAEQIDIVGLQEHQCRHRIGGKRSAVILVVDEFFLPARLGRSLRDRREHGAVGKQTG